MKYVDEFRDPTLARRYADAIARIATRPWSIMEICGGQTHSIVRHGIDQMLPRGVTLLHGPGCPVCVTPSGIIDAADGSQLTFAVYALGPVSDNAKQAIDTLTAGFYKCGDNLTNG